MKFDEDKVITPFHKDKAVAGKIYFYEDSLYELRERVENDSDLMGTLLSVDEYIEAYPFCVECYAGDKNWQFIYPAEED